MNVVEEMPAYSSMAGFMCGRVFDVQGLLHPGLLCRVNARSFAQLGLRAGGCKLSFLPPTVEYFSTMRGMTKACKITVYPFLNEELWLLEVTRFSLWQHNWEPLLSVLDVGSLINHVSLFPSLSIYLKCRFLRCRAMCTTEKHCKWGSLCHPMLFVMKSILAAA